MEFFSKADLIGTLPLLVVFGCSLLLLLLDALFKDAKKLVFSVGIIGMLTAIGCSLYTFPLSATAFSDMVLVGGYASFFNILFLTIGIIVFLLSYSYLEKQHYHLKEFYTLIVISISGMMLMASSADLIIIFLGIEIMSVCFYVLAGYKRIKVEGNEAALKYFLLGAFATGFLLYGIALIYGTMGTTNLIRISQNFDAFSHPLYLAGWGLLLIGFSFKIAAVPFHMWAPDVYEGSLTTVTALMSTGGKAAAFSSFILAFSIPLSMHNEKLMMVIAILSAASMLIGNVFGLAQKNIKRMLAYSSIAHAGYMLVGLASGTKLGMDGIIFYLISYSLTNLGAFGIISIFEKENGGNLSYEDYAGLGSRKPILAALLSLCMFSLVGIPPFAGFIGKYYLFASAVQSNLTWLAIIGVMTSLVSTYYYLRIVVYMYFRESQQSELIFVPSLALASVVLVSIGIFIFGIFPSLILNVIQNLL